LSSNPNLGNTGGKSGSLAGQNVEGDGKNSSKGFYANERGTKGAGGAAAGGADSAFGSGGAGFGYNDNYGAGGADSSGGAGGSRGSGISPEDTKRLSEAISNRDKDSDKYDRQDGMSLWEIVTNTYIRVYDRLLERKSNNLD